MIAGYAAAFVVGVATNRPFVANGLADRIMEATPPGLATVILSALGVAAKPFAVGGALALAAALAAMAGWIAQLESRRARAAGPTTAQAAADRGMDEVSPGLPHTGPLAGAIVEFKRGLPLTAALAATQAAIVGKLSLHPSLEGVLIPYVVWAFAFLALARPSPNSGRRWFLQRSFQAAAGLVLLSTVASWTLLLKTLAGAQPGRPLFPFRPPAPRNPEFAGVEKLTPEVTPVTSLYLMSKTVEDPSIAPDSWRLRITGLVGRQLELSYDDLQRLPRVDQWLTLRCVSNPVGGPLIGNALWSGVPLASLLDTAGVSPSASTLVMRARDTYSDSIPLDRARLPGTLLAYAIDGDFLNRDHGFPARVLVPGLYGFKNVKWVEELELVAGDFSGPWQRLGWTKTAIQTTFSRIDFVRRGLAGGVAFAGDRGIRRVEVRVGDEPWRAAHLQPPLGALAWTQWLFPFEASGQVTLTVRATDGTGALQEEAERPIFPDGATGWHSVTAGL
ncbi:MAG TPA: molybdopterin-dependent oxidoreductase [Chloroflexota bacterium]|nr:molybdopterin-dependent oxidoreductase [Chloroflexota bacterium]